MSKNNVVFHEMEGNKLLKAKIRRLAFTSLFSFHLMITYIILLIRHYTSLSSPVCGKNMRFRLTRS